MTAVPSGSPRHLLIIVAVAAGLAALLLGGCGEQREPAGPSPQRPVAEDPGPVHVHGLGVNPEDGALFIATHTGLFRAPEGQSEAKRVGDRYQDTMGFTVVGPDHFLGSGHPDGREQLPPFLGLLESRDAGATWRPISRLGESDFHVLEAAGRRVYGFGSNFETRKPEFLVSGDGGRSWAKRRFPTQLISLAIDPANGRRVVASGPDGLFSSHDEGRSWKPLDGDPGLLTWPPEDELYLVALGGQVSRSSDGGRRWQAMGRVRGDPAAFEAGPAGALYVALHDGTILESIDRGRSWRVRSRP